MLIYSYSPLLVFILSTLLSLFIFPKLNSIAKYLDITDKPNKRKQHKNPVVHIGGLGMILVFLLVINFSLIFLGTELDFRYLVLIFGSLYFFIIGFTDDLLVLSPFLRLFLQFLGAIIIWHAGLKVSLINLSWLNIYWDKLVLSDLVSFLFTSFIVLGAINAINWLDGLDGLASGSVFISSLGLGILFLLNGNYEGLVATSILSGICFGFLKYNFYPAKLIMGDGGSYFLGFYVIYLVIISTFNGVSEDPFGIFIPILMIGIPVLDMTLVLLSGLLRRKSLFFPDRSHIHHKLLNYGMSHKNSVLIIYVLSQWLVFLALLFTNLLFKEILFSVSSIFLLIFLFNKFSKND